MTGEDMSKRPTIRTNKGFTLIEVMIAIVIFSISLLALVPVLVTAVSVDTDDFLKARAEAMLTTKIDELLADDINTITNGNDQATQKGVVLNRVWTVTPDTGNLQKISVTVTYIYKGQQKQFATEVKKGL
jgi:prepilin-type N-terminal cleavage/methylation domain-containing protein